ncbi:NAD(P)-dependent dehydrogenase (short-subunit alcohol dehydrogenase family) [Mycobacterium sp. URHB0021]|jgi:NAD(P)-dependent dehydrogenase (short-subunit alcohol dehydrogenase family)
MIMGQLTGKIALVTGGSSGIGLAAAQRFADEGAYVFVAGRDQEKIDKAVASIGDASTGIRCDVSDDDDLQNAHSAIAAHGRGLDVLFVNAGGGAFAPLAEVTREDFLTTFRINAGGSIFTVQKMLPLLSEGASVILTGSSAASEGTPAFGVYAASKAAIRSLGRTWAAELMDRGIRVNTLVPGTTDTPGLRNLAPAGQEQALVEGQAAKVPMGRAAAADEIAAAALFLASDQSSYMTGAEMFVDGGLVQL